MKHKTKTGTAYTLQGATDAPLVVLIHGLGLNQHTWREFMPALCQRYRVLNYDLFGHGDSAKPPSVPTLGLFAQQLDELLDELQLAPSAIVGFSLGGMINRRFALDYPERAQALVILNSPHQRSAAAQQRVEHAATQAADSGVATNIDAMLSRWFTPEFRHQRPDLVEQVRAWVLSNDPMVYAQCRHVLATGVLELIAPQPPIKTPTLVITCENDPGSTPAMAQAIATEINPAECLIIPHLQHLGLIEQPSLFTPPVLQFLGRVVVS